MQNMGRYTGLKGEAMVVTTINGCNGGTWLTITYESFDNLDSMARSPPILSHRAMQEKKFYGQVSWEKKILEDAMKKSIAKGKEILMGYRFSKCVVVHFSAQIKSQGETNETI